MFTSQFLKDVKLRALRKRVWFRALDGLERGILSLASQVTDVVQSTVLGVELVKIVKKLNDAMKCGFVKLVEGYGFKHAREVCGVAYGWGYSAARGWASDLGFAKYLAFIKFNSPTGFGV